MALLQCCGIIGLDLEHLSQCSNHSAVQTQSTEAQLQPQDPTFEFYLPKFDPEFMWKLVLKKMPIWKPPDIKSYLKKVF